jgi:hypothetical protein
VDQRTREYGRMKNKRIKNDRRQYQSRADIGQCTLKDENDTLQQKDKRENFAVDQSGYFDWISEGKA